MSVVDNDGMTVVRCFSKNKNKIIGNNKISNNFNFEKKKNLEKMNNELRKPESFKHRKTACNAIGSCFHGSRPHTLCEIAKCMLCITLNKKLPNSNDSLLKNLVLPTEHDGRVCTLGYTKPGERKNNGPINLENFVDSIKKILLNGHLDEQKKKEAENRKINIWKNRKYDNYCIDDVVEDTNSSTLIVEDTKSSTPVKDIKSSTIVEETKSSTLVVEDIKSSTLVVEDIKSSTLVAEDIKSSTLVVEDIKSSTLVVEDIKSSTLVEETKPSSLELVVQLKFILTKNSKQHSSKSEIKEINSVNDSIVSETTNHIIFEKNEYDELKIKFEKLLQIFEITGLEITPEIQKLINDAFEILSKLK